MPDETMDTNHAPPTEKQQRRGRINFNKSLARRYDLELIQQVVPTLRALDQFRFLTSSQIARLLFLGQPTIKGTTRSYDAARKAANEMCLRRLKDLQLVEVQQFPYRVSRTVWGRREVQILTRRGRDLLAEHPQDGYTIRWHEGLKYFSPWTLNHTFLINEAAIAAISCAYLKGWEVPIWYDDDQLDQLRHEGSVAFENFVPDGLLLLRAQGRLQPYFLEADRGTEDATGNAANTWQKKIERYQDYLATRYTDDPLLVGLPRPLVLTVTTSPARLASLLTATAKAQGQRTYWFTTVGQISPLAPLRPKTDGLGEEARRRVREAYDRQREQHSAQYAQAFFSPIWQANQIKGVASLEHQILGLRAA